jgi:hypothetical protein
MMWWQSLFQKTCRWSAIRLWQDISCIYQCWTRNQLGNSSPFCRRQKQTLILFSRSSQGIIYSIKFKKTLVRHSILTWKQHFLNLIHKLLRILIQMIFCFLFIPYHVQWHCHNLLNRHLAIAGIVFQAHNQWWVA